MPSQQPITAIMVHVAEPDAALTWYARLFPRAQRRVSGDGTFPYLVLDGVQLEFVSSDAKVASGPAGTIVYWHVPDLDSALCDAEALGAQRYRGPMQIEPGTSMCQVRDPWGNCIGLRGATQ